MKGSELLPAIVLAAAVLVGGVGCTSDTDQDDALSNPQDTSEFAYDAQLAAELGADDYGMRRYVMALLKAGPNRDQDSTAAMELQQAHMENIRRLAEEGALILAGPFLDDGALRGIYVFNVSTVEEARALTATDPAIQAGRLEMELHPWYGSAALLKVNEMQPRISREAP